MMAACASMDLPARLCILKPPETAQVKSSMLSPWFAGGAAWFAHDDLRQLSAIDARAARR
jgi:hypothetical protein